MQRAILSVISFIASNGAVDDLEKNETERKRSTIVDFVSFMSPYYKNVVFLYVALFSVPINLILCDQKIFCLTFLSKHMSSLSLL